MSGEICPNTGDMDDCSKKPRCKWGNCEGQSLPGSGDYCPVGYSFLEESCSCAPVDCGPVCDLDLRYKLYYDTFTGPCTPTQDSCTGFGGSFLEARIDNVIQGSDYEFVIKEGDTGDIGICTGTRPPELFARVTRCVNGLPTIQDILLGNGDFCNLNTSAGYTIREVEEGESFFSNCRVNISTTSQRWYNTYDCFDCSGVLVNQVKDPSVTSVRSTTVADYESAYLDCSGISEGSCDTSCIWRTPGGEAWRDQGWTAVTNCDAAGTPDSGQAFTCPDNVQQPCNAWQQASLRYYANAGRLFDVPKLIDG